MSKFSRIITLVTLVSIVMGGLSLGAVEIEGWIGEPDLPIPNGYEVPMDPPVGDPAEDQRPGIPGVPGEVRECRIRHANTVRILYDGRSACPARGGTADLRGAQAICCVFDTLYVVTDWVFWAVMLLVMLFIILGAFFITTAGGNDEKVGKGKKFIIFAVVGAVVGMMARIIPGLVASMMGLVVV